jgi:hypothetical protein
MEQLWETTAALARQGRTFRSGLPRPFDLALFIREFEQEVQAPFAPGLARAATAPLAWVAARRGLTLAQARDAASQARARRPAPPALARDAPARRARPRRGRRRPGGADRPGQADRTGASPARGRMSRTHPQRRACHLPIAGTGDRAQGQTKPRSSQQEETMTPAPQVTTPQPRRTVSRNTGLLIAAEGAAFALASAAHFITSFTDAAIRN